MTHLPTSNSAKSRIKSAQNTKLVIAQKRLQLDFAINTKGESVC